MSIDASKLHARLGELVASLLPGSRVTDIKAFDPDERPEGATAKSIGYGRPLRLGVIDPDGHTRTLVFRTAVADDFGHDRRSDRAQELLLDYDTFDRIPGHVRALDFGALDAEGHPISLRGAGEPYIVTEFAPGEPYAQDLRRIARGEESAIDARRCEALARWLVALHQPRSQAPSRYRRSIRDLVGHGEGIFGIIDGYPSDVPAASPERLQGIERLCVEWRWRLRGGEDRLARTHGDFHPFNVIFQDGDRFALLDTSRGSEGEPADDVTCMAINYLFFALEASPPGRKALGRLWHLFWSTYLTDSQDTAVLRAAPPFLAWRGLVLSSPRFYPGLPSGARDTILSFVESALGSTPFDVRSVDELFR